MKKVPVIATMLLIMGLLLFPACEGDKGMEPAELLLFYNCKYYLEFEVDYENDGHVHEHVEMRVKEPFDLISYDNWYQGIFTEHYDYISLNIPETTIGPIIYNGGTGQFKFIYYKGIDRYASYADHVFTFSIFQWDEIGGEIYAEFSGELSDNHTGAETTIAITNGKVFSRKNK